MRAWGVGEILWDIFADEERFGGAALNFCVNLKRLGDQPTLWSAVARDARGELALARMQELGLETAHIGIVDAPSTGVAVVGMTESGEPTFVIPRPAAFDMLSVDPAQIQRLMERDGGPPDWLYFGTLMQTQSSVEELTTRLAQSAGTVRCFYDMNLRAEQWNLPLVHRLSNLAHVVKLNEYEAEILYRLTRTNDAPYSLEGFCRGWAAEHDIAMMCVTLGGEGCFVFANGEPHRVPGFSIQVSDTVGAGDAFAAAFLHGLHRGKPVRAIARFANAVGALVASRRGATPDWTVDECLGLMHQG